MKCIDFETAAEKEIISFLKDSEDNIVICIETRNPNGSVDLNYRCGKRSQIRMNNRKTLVNSGRTYYLTYNNMYVCPVDKATLQNTNYCFFKFEYLRPDGKNHIYNVKKYTLDDYMKIDF